MVEALRSILRDEQRIEVARLGAKYAESAAWLYEDTDNMTDVASQSKDEGSMRDLSLTIG